ncbi:MAG: copper resistance protein B, partial [Parasphingorhabdus sp.]
MKALMIILLLGAPALAQHEGHRMPVPVKPAAKAKPAPPKPVAKPAPKAVVKPKAAPTVKPKAPVPVAKPAPAKPAQMDHDAMNHADMDHGEPQNDPMDDAAMDHSAMDHSAHQPDRPQISLPNLETGPIRAADAIWGQQAMQPARDALYDEHGNMQIFWFQGDRLEYRVRQDDDGYLWDVQGYYGGDIHKFWFKSEGEGSFGEPVDSAELQGLYSRAIAPFFDLQAGIRQDLAGPERTHAVVGIQGLAPYMFEVDAAAFLSTKGDLTARIEAEYDQRLTQRLILQPRAEANLSAQDIPELGIGSGIDNLELGLRLRYEIAREFAPY